MGQPHADTVPKPQADGKTPLASPLGDLSEAIDVLRGACNRLQSSVAGANSDLEAANDQLQATLEQHAQAAAYLESVLASIPTGVIVVDRQGRIAVFNNAAESMTGFSRDEVTGKSYSDTVGRRVPRNQTPLYTLASGSAINASEKTLHTKTGNGIPVSFSTSLLIDAGKVIKGAIEVITDLRTTRMLEEEVARAKTLATIGEVASVVAHEIRNPLGGIKGFVSLLERDLEDNPGAISILGRISEGIEALEVIANDLLDAGRHSKLTVSHTELGLEIERLIELFEMAAKGEGRDVWFEFCRPEAPIYCRVDRDKIRQALSNLLRNATEAVGKSGKVTVTLRNINRPHVKGKMDSGAPSARDYLSIEVTDTGPGISKDLLDKIFSPFFTTKRDGTGLGLSTVRRIVALHGGEIRYSQSDSGGSAFTIELPRW